MGLFRRSSKPHKPGTVRTGGNEDLEHLRAFAGSRQGVEGYVEPATHTTATTLVLVARDGEWTRRRIGTPKVAFDLGRELAIPVYDVAATGYPASMRAWTAARKAAGETRAH